ncbi:MAG: hypothetical protein K2I63_02420, partial [Helicobacter sp.]|nr:hypothetical protein [Helicobacter sp.]
APLEENMQIYLQDNFYYKPIPKDFKLPLEELYPLKNKYKHSKLKSKNSTIPHFLGCFCRNLC